MDVEPMVERDEMYDNVSLERDFALIGFREGEEYKNQKQDGNGDGIVYRCWGSVGVTNTDILQLKVSLQI